MPKRINLLGKRFGRLVVTAYAQDQRWSCVCDCGVRVVVNGAHLRGSTTKSCGCLSKARATKHGMHGSKEYHAWKNMKQRCSNPRHVAYENYGGRGISVCEEWLSFEGFFADMGACPPGLSLDRYPDNDGNYTPGNCRWADAKQQSQNQRPRRTRTAVKRRRREQAEPLPPPPLDDPPF